MPDIFLSYSRDDQATARRFAEAFQREGLSVWWDQALNPGEAFDRVTELALEDAKAVVVLWSRKSVDSRWVRAEATQANSNGTLVPVMIEPCKRPIMFELTHTVDLSHWKGSPDDATWQSYVAGVRRFVNKDMAEAPSPSIAQPVAGSRKKVTAIAVAIGTAALVIAGAVLWMMYRTPTAAKDVTLAVLPFADISTAHDQEAFSDGLSEEILNQLAQIQDLTVTGRTSSFAFKGKNEDLRVIAKTLGVANLLEGSIRKEGDQLRITAQLINGKSGTHMWSKTYARERAEIFAVQEEIAKDVAQALSVRLDVGESSLEQGGTTNVDAYERYLQARGLGLEGGTELTLKSIQLLREAVAFDPAFSRAWLSLGGSLGDAAIVSSPSEIAGLQREREAALEHGIALAPETPAAQSVRIAQLVEKRQWSEADALFRKLMASNSGPGRIQLEAGAFLTFLSATGRIRELIGFMKNAAQLEPLSQLVSTSLQTNLTAAGEDQAAQAEYERGKTLAGSRARGDFRALLRLLYQGAAPTAVEDQYRKLMQEPSSTSQILKDVFDPLGNRAAALGALQKAFENPANQNQAQLVTIYQLADAFGDKTLALAVLHRLVTKQNFMTALWVAPHSGLRLHPEFKKILKETGLADYFRAGGNWGDFCRPVGKEDFECR